MEGPRLGKDTDPCVQGVDSPLPSSTARRVCDQEVSAGHFLPFAQPHETLSPACGRLTHSLQQVPLFLQEGSVVACRDKRGPLYPSSSHKAMSRPARLAPRCLPGCAHIHRALGLSLPEWASLGSWSLGGSVCPAARAQGAEWQAHPMVSDHPATPQAP